MAVSLSSTSTHQFPYPPTNSTPPRLLTNRNLPFTFHLHHLSPPFPCAWPGRCRAASPGRPPPPPAEESAPPTAEDPAPSPGPAATFARLQDNVQIFLAVLFWMSLFFWASAWDDGRDNGRPNKGSRFRR